MDEKLLDPEPESKMVQQTNPKYFVCTSKGKLKIFQLISTMICMVVMMLEGYFFTSLTSSFILSMIPLTVLTSIVYFSGGYQRRTYSPGRIAKTDYLFTLACNLLCLASLVITSHHVTTGSRSSKRQVILISVNLLALFSFPLQLPPMLFYPCRCGTPASKQATAATKKAPANPERIVRLESDEKSAANEISEGDDKKHPADAVPEISNKVSLIEDMIPEDCDLQEILIDDANKTKMSQF